MLVVVKLIKSVFSYLFISMMAIEILFLIFSFIGYNGSLKKNLNKINDLTLKAHNEIYNSFYGLITTEFSNVRADLLMIAKHINPMYLTISDKKNISNNYLKFNKDSHFFRNLSNFNPFVFYKTDNTTQENIITLRWKAYENETENFSFEENTIIDKFLEDPVFNNIFSYLKKETLDKLIIEEDRNLKAYVNYLIPILKSIMIRNAIYDKKKIIYLKFQIILRNQILLEYPPNQIEESKAINNLIFNTNIDNTDSDLAASVSPLKTLSDKLNGKETNNRFNKVLFDQFKFNSEGELISRGCIKIDYTGENNSFACIEFGLEPIFNSINRNYIDTEKYNYNKFVTYFLYGVETENKNPNLFFSSRLNKTNISNRTNQKSDQMIDLLEGFYSMLNMTEDEYIMFDNNIEFSKNYKKYYTSIIDTNISQFNLTYKTPSNEYKSDNYVSITKPLHINYLEFNETNFIFDFNKNSTINNDSNPILVLLLVLILIL